jgi:hypothetical protein
MAGGEFKACKKGHPMKFKMGRDGRKHWHCPKCRNAAARARRAGQESSGGRRKRSSALSMLFGSDTLWAVNGDFYRREDNRE